MSQTSQCPQCKAELPASAPHGLCPACLLQRGLETNTLAYTQEARWTPPDIQELASRFPELEIQRLIGRGGMGAVYQARQKNLDRTVALKILPPEMNHDPAQGEFAERFAREAQAMARLNHPHIVAIHEFGQRQELYYFVMEYVDGVSLRSLLNAGHISPKEALAIVPQICEALQYAHDQGIVHRDIKPENILLSRQGQVKIADFGLAKLMGKASSAAEKVMGTPQYMAPEQLQRPTEVDHRADIYSLGVVFYQMLTGELPRGAFAPPSRKVQIDVRLDEIVLRALEKEPERRYQQASEIKTDVETVAASRYSSAAELSAPATPTQSLRRRLWKEKSPYWFHAKDYGWGWGLPATWEGWLFFLAWFLSTGIGTCWLGVAGHIHFAYAFLSLMVAIALVVCFAKGEPLRWRWGNDKGGIRSSSTTVDPAVRLRDKRLAIMLTILVALAGFLAVLIGSLGEKFVGIRNVDGASSFRGASTLAQRDNVDLPFINDPAVIGAWQSVDFVADPSEFDPDTRKWREELYLKELTFLVNGQTLQPWWTWTKGLLIHHGDQTASRYEICQINGQSYLFLEWKSGDVMIRGMKPHYYVLRKNSAAAATTRAATNLDQTALQSAANYTNKGKITGLWIVKPGDD